MTPQQEKARKEKFVVILVNTLVFCGIDAAKENFNAWYDRLKEFPLEQIGNGCRKFEEKPGPKFLNEFGSFLLSYCRSADTRPNVIEVDGVTRFLSYSMNGDPVYITHEEQAHIRYLQAQPVMPRLTRKQLAIEDKRHKQQVEAEIASAQPDEDLSRKAAAMREQLTKMATIATASEGE